jgi:hypothetical protein
LSGSEGGCRIPTMVDGIYPVLPNFGNLIPKFRDLWR